jgi:hypothetical protein
MPELEKVHFRLERDEDGFPPADVESLWARRIDSTHYRLDNVPFFARGVACEDVVEVRDVDGTLWFLRVTEEGGHGTIRVFIYDEPRLERIKDSVRGFGCDVEQSHIPGYFSVDVAPNSKKQELLAFLRKEEEAEAIGYEEGCKTW